MDLKCLNKFALILTMSLLNPFTKALMSQAAFILRREYVINLADGTLRRI
jgi:hypothetical protein